MLSSDAGEVLLEPTEYVHNKANIDYMLKLNNVRKYVPKKTLSDLSMIGVRLKEIRQYMNLSLRERGQKLNYSFSTLASYERGKN